MVVKHWKEVKETEFQDPHAVGVAMRVLIGQDDGAPNFIMRHFTVEPGGQSPYHSHPWEHEVFVLSGLGEVRQGENSWSIGPGSVVYIPPGEGHQFVNKGDETLEFICLIPKV